MELKWRLGLRFGNCLGLLIVLNGIEILQDVQPGCASGNLLIVLNGIEILE